MEAYVRALDSLAGLSVGDAFGETFFARRDQVLEMARANRPAPPPWRWTDDTAMAISIVEELGINRSIDGDRLARRFATRHATEPLRGYGAGAHELLSRIAQGESWRTASRSLFRGTGSFGNGAAMRAAPIGAYFAPQLDHVVIEARRSAEVTHAHPEGIAGAVAVAVAAAEAWRTRDDEWDRDGFFRVVALHTPAGHTRDGIEQAAALPTETTVVEAAVALGNGGAVSSADTVSFALWCLAEDPDSYQDTLWTTATGLGDVDTTCAIVGGITVLRTGRDGIPESWLQAREPLPELDLA